ncbi:MAG: hypothetical protein ABJO01_00555 [Parasphingorhabdus sp.]
MDQNPGVSLVQQAAALSGSSAHISYDLAAVLFPKSDIFFSDRMLSNGRQYLQSIVQEIETELCRIAVEDFGLSHDMIVEIGNSDRGHSFSMLQNSGLLQGKAVLEHIFSNVQRVELKGRLSQKASQADLESVLTRYLDHDDSQIADAAMALLVAQSRDNAGAAAIRASITNLPAEILYALTWPITAAVEKLSGYEGGTLKTAAEKLLGRHDEGATIQSRAQRLAQLVDANPGDENQMHPLHDGLDLFLARMAQRTGLTADQLTIFSAEPNMVRLIVAMRAIDLPMDRALSIFGLLETGGQLLTPASYNEIDYDHAVDLISDLSSNSLFQDAQQRLNRSAAGLTD